MAEKLWTWARFKALKEKIKKKEWYTDKEAAATAASIGRKKYGKERFAKLIAKGKK